MDTGANMPFQVGDQVEIITREISDPRLRYLGGLWAEIEGELVGGYHRIRVVTGERVLAKPRCLRKIDPQDWFALCHLKHETLTV